MGKTKSTPSPPDFAWTVGHALEFENALVVLASAENRVLVGLPGVL